MDIILTDDVDSYIVNMNSLSRLNSENINEYLMSGGVIIFRDNYIDFDIISGKINISNPGFTIANSSSYF